ncbi:MAG: GHMP kinase, partial [Roseiflexaceae bacterium]|nr:GHMP kinase [Roseiflexaceae bacterium]
MWQVDRAPHAGTPDFERFLATLNAEAGFFRTDAPITVARAPGRLDLMGGIADYSGALVLELPLGVATFAAVQPDPEPVLTLVSLEVGLDQPQVTIPLSVLFPGGQALGYAQARALLNADPRASWAAYVAGVLVVLAHERGLLPQTGLRILIDSAVPAGKGVSSSAAIEVAAMSAVLGVMSRGSGKSASIQSLNPDPQPLAPREIAMLCQKVENLVVGAPCGVMDQMTSALGEQGRLLALLCQPAEVQGSVALPPELAVWGIDSGIRHAVSGADYGSVRVGAFMGRRMLLEREVFNHEEHKRSATHSYLVSVTPSLWEQQLRQHVPLEILGADFLARYGATGDDITTVDPARIYAVRQPTAHPIYEHQRVQLFRALLQAATDNGHLLGELMFQSHASYSACGLGSAGTDLLIELVRDQLGGGLYGAKITGGGSGGTVAVLGRSDAAAAVQR